MRLSDDELKWEDLRMGWRENAHNQAVAEADADGVQGAEREAFINKREGEIYAELEKIGTENL